MMTQLEFPMFGPKPKDRGEWLLFKVYDDGKREFIRPWTYTVNWEYAERCVKGSNKVLQERNAGYQWFLTGEKA